MRLNEGQRHALSDKLLDFANLVGASTIIGQIFSERTNWGFVIIGFITVLILYIYSVYLRR